VREYLAVLDDAAFAAATPVVPFGAKLLELQAEFNYLLIAAALAKVGVGGSNLRACSKLIKELGDPQRGADRG
jgi:hypothetical protein